MYIHVHVHAHAHANYDDLFDHLVYRLSVKVDLLSIIQLSQITFLTTGRGIFESNMIVLFITYTQECNIIPLLAVYNNPAYIGYPNMYWSC